MVAASQVRNGMAIRFENQVYKVLSAEYQPGQGKMGGVMHARLKNLVTGTTWEHGFRAEQRLEEVAVEKRLVEYLYQDSDDCILMDPETYEQIAVAAAIVGPQLRLLAPQMRVSVEFVDGQPVAVTLPDVLEVKVADTTPPVHGTQDSTWKAAKLENGVQVMVPQFVKTGDVIRLSTADLRYMDRAKTQSR
jgi:elongation factor P